MVWSPDHYLRFGDERTRPAIDLAHRVALDEPRPRSIVDLGCGPGNSTQVLRTRWPSAHVVGVDGSDEMIAAAGAAYPQQHWVRADIGTWTPEVPVDLVFSNAALHWLGDHAALLPRLVGFVATDGALAFQVPSDAHSRVRRAIREIAADERWQERVRGPSDAVTFESPAFYYDVLSPVARSLDIWETEYVHVLDDAGAIVDWIASTGLRPVLDVLSPSEAEEFLARLTAQVEVTYPKQTDGRVLYPFRRLFVIAYAQETSTACHHLQEKRN